jgi:hypothetical protein
MVAAGKEERERERGRERGGEKKSREREGEGILLFFFLASGVDFGWLAEVFLGWVSSV